MSENPISRETERQIFDVLIQTFTKLDDARSLKAFMDDLLTPTEKVMVAKRLMVAVLLQRGYAPGAVCSILKMSKATVNGIRRDLHKHGEGYRLVFKKFFDNPQVEKFIGSVEKWLNALRLPIKGSRSDMQRWKRALARL